MVSLKCLTQIQVLADELHDQGEQEHRGVEPVFHFEGAGRERDDADALALAGQEAGLQGFDQRLRRLLVEVLVVGGHRGQHRKHLQRNDNMNGPVPM